MSAGGVQRQLAAVGKGSLAAAGRDVHRLHSCCRTGTSKAGEAGVGQTHPEAA
jgi:hypothetical protein